MTNSAIFLFYALLGLFFSLLIFSIIDKLQVVQQEYKLMIDINRLAVCREYIYD